VPKMVPYQNEKRQGVAVGKTGCVNDASGSTSFFGNVTGGRGALVAPLRKEKIAGVWGGKAERAPGRTFISGFQHARC